MISAKSSMLNVITTTTNTANNNNNNNNSNNVDLFEQCHITVFTILKVEAKFEYRGVGDTDNV